MQETAAQKCVTQPHACRSTHSAHEDKHSHPQGNLKHSMQAMGACSLRCHAMLHGTNDTWTIWLWHPPV